MPTHLPERDEDGVTFPAVPLLAVPASIVMLSALCDVDGFSAQALAEVLSRAGEALTLGEWGLLRYRPE